MSDDKKMIIRKTEEITNAVSDMKRAMDKTPEAKVEMESKISSFKKKYPDARYIEPKHRIPTKGIRCPEKDKQKDFMHEYVVGIFESAIIGSTLSFWKDGLPGDDFCMWEIPANKPIGIPRHVAKHLSENLSWKEMKPLGRDNEPQAFYEEDMVIPFTRFETKRRGTFHPINAF